MGRLTEFFGWRDIPPSELTPLWCAHNLAFINNEKDDLKKLRKVHLKSIRDKKKEALVASKSKTEEYTTPTQHEVDWGQ